MNITVQNLSMENLHQKKDQVAKETNLFMNSEQHELKTPAVKRTNFGKQNLNLFQNISNSTSSTASSSDNNSEEFNCPERQFRFSQIVIDTNDDLESRIHDWLDKQNVIITNPYDKIADYYHQLRIQAFNRFIDCFSINENCENDPFKLETFQAHNNLSRQQSTLVMSSSPIIQRRNKILSSDNPKDHKQFSLRKNLRNGIGEEVVISEFQHA
ncbi:hypothetical protein TTHERM_00726000 (macronuclear) [Tetrahymena thermophila SB210]|uniref:Uncharacterized protein n=1 Tax=Tetrahymena thermophila (strain SB210) TaxID=312017 RepID=Q24GJ0_TETTS|nr:hypothetical protein TTHERM_00726000 [Tetrahymena thermophila SB210]EAS06881.1 hypothetical protein TTHERM_00726000 [Tetrahymena thermophila SB210]|eukprot:XP_001027123.1 hypothetical protein TTHERM_00726000 [Tetrahymena thermophila SB210]